MGKAASEIATRRRALEDASIEGCRDELVHVCRNVLGGKLALLRSVSEHPDWPLERLCALAEWRVRHGLDAEGVKTADGRACPGCYNLLPLESVATWCAPEERSRLEKQALPSDGQAPRRRAGRARGGYVHPSMARDVSPSLDVSQLPLADMNDDGQARTVVEATSGFDLGSLSPIADWALARRYGMSPINATEAMPAEAATAGPEETGRMVREACAQLAPICAEVDRSLKGTSQMDVGKMRERRETALGKGRPEADDQRARKRALEEAAKAAEEEEKRKREAEAPKEAPRTAGEMISAVTSALANKKPAKRLFGGF